MNDTTRTYTQRGIAAQRRRTAQLEALDRRTRDIDARLNRRAFSPDLTLDQLEQMVEPDTATQRHAEARRDALELDRLEAELTPPVDEDLAELFED